MHHPSQHTLPFHSGGTKVGHKKLDIFHISEPTKRNLIRIALIILICVIDVFIGGKAKPNILILIVVAVFGGIIAVVFLRNIVWGILAIVPVSFFARWDVGTGTNVAFNLTIVLCLFMIGMWFLRGILIDRRVVLVPSRLNAPAITLITVLTLSLVVGNIQWIPQASAKASLFAQIGGWLLYVLSICALLLPGNVIKDLRILRIVVWQFLILGFIFIYSYLVPFTAHFASSVFVNAGSFGSTFWIWATAFAVSFLMFGKKRERIISVFLIFLLAAIFYRGWFLYREWISGWGPPLVAVIVILWLRNWRLALVAMLIGGIGIGLQFAHLSSAVMTDTQQYSVYSRTSTWPILFELIKASPVFGLGPSNYPYYTPLFSLLGWHVMFNSHNNYLDIVAQYGFLGLIAFIWLILEIGRLAWRLKSEIQDEFSRIYVHACIGGLVAMLVSGMLGDWFFPFLYNISTVGFRFSVVNWLFLGGLVVIDQAVKQNEA